MLYLGKIILIMAKETSRGGDLFSAFIPLILIFAIFYFLLIRPQQKRQRELQKMISQLKKGDRVITTGGIYGTIASIKEKSILLKVDENTKIEVAKSAIAGVVEKKS